MRNHKPGCAPIRQGILLVAVAFLLASPSFGVELSCEQSQNIEGGCCCFQKSHTYEFEPRSVARLEVTFDTGRGIGCRSQVAIEVLRRNGWQTLRAVDAVSSDGRSQLNRLSDTFRLDETISGVRVGDGGRCYIDYSKVVLDERGDKPEDVGESPPIETGRPGGLISGTYRLEAFSGRRHQSVWHLEVANGSIKGTSEWDCCPGRRNDGLKGTVQGDRVQIVRSCTGQGLSGRCSETYEGRVTNAGVVTGTWSHNDRFAGKWRLEPEDTFPPPESPPPGPAARIVAEPAPPYREVPVTIEFNLRGARAPDAEWWMDGRRMTNADFFFWTFGGAGNHRVEVRSGGQTIVHHNVRLKQPTGQRVEIVPDKAPPFDLPATLTFRQEPRPISGARWYVDGSYASSGQTLTREFLEAGSYDVILQSNQGEVLARYEVALEAASYRLWGRRRSSRSGARNDLRELELERSAMVIEVEGNARSYCIWTVTERGAIDQRVVCGSARDSIEGAILLPGRYVVAPDLADDQSSAEVTVILRSR